MTSLFSAFCRHDHEHDESSHSDTSDIVTDIVSVGGAAFDVFVRAPHSIGTASGTNVIQFPLGSKVKVESVIQSCGGGASNTSVGFSRLGMQARFCGVIADDEWGQCIQHTLQSEGVYTDAAILVEGEISSFSIILVDAASGRRTVLYSPNVNAHMCDPVFPRAILRKSRWMFLNHLSDVSCVILDDCLDLVRKPDGVRFAWNPGGSQIRDGYQDPLIAHLLSETDILFLNAEETRTFARTDDMLEALRRCSAAGVRHMCITDGAHGAVLTDGETVWHCPIEEDVSVVDATGAGDAFAVGVTWGIHSDLPLSECLRAGMINAASVIGFVGTQRGLLSHTELTTRLTSSSLRVAHQLLSSNASLPFLFSPQTRT